MLAAMFDLTSICEGQIEGSKADPERYPDRLLKIRMLIRMSGEPPKCGMEIAY